MASNHPPQQNTRWPTANNGNQEPAYPLQDIVVPAIILTSPQRTTATLADGRLSFDTDSLFSDSSTIRPPPSPTSRQPQLTRRRKYAIHPCLRDCCCLLFVLLFITILGASVTGIVMLVNYQKARSTAKYLEECKISGKCGPQGELGH